jgi:hypothetical protein
MSTMSKEAMVLFSLVGLHAVWVLLPLVPAILIYWLFPNTAVAVSGPLASLTVRASGAFAAYLAVFLVTYPLVQRTEETIGGFQHPFWKITGQVKLIDNDGNEMQSEDALSRMVVRTEPAPFSVAGYDLWINIPQPEDLPPRLFVEIPGFGTKWINLNNKSSDISRDEYHKIIEIKTPIIIKRNPVKGESLAAQPLVDRGTREVSAQAR